MRLETMPLLEWYKRYDVQYEIIKSTKNREFVMLTPKHLRDEEIDHFGKNKKMGVLDRRYLRCHRAQDVSYFFLKMMSLARSNAVHNAYYSMCKYKKGIPYFNANPLLRDTSDWKKNHWKELEGYDWPIDIDAGGKEDMELAKYSALELMKLFDSCKVPYSVRFSGMGYHLVVPYEWTNTLNQCMDPNAEQNLWKYLTSLGKELHDTCSEMIDYSIADSRRVLKVPYGAGVYPDGIYVCWPFSTRKEVEQTSRSDFKLSNYIDVSLRGRGVETFNKSDSYNPEKLLNHLGFERVLK